MKKRLFVISLVVSMLVFLMPAPALAKAPAGFSAGGVITAIDTGTVFPAGNSGRYVVASRSITGALAGGITGDFVLNYKANVELATQAGSLQGNLQAGTTVLKVNGSIEPLEFAGWWGEGIPLYRLTINGRWTAIDGMKGNGDFSAWAVFIPTPEGHVFAIVDSGFDMTGK
jgi:hypothetical protein